MTDRVLLEAGDSAPAFSLPDQDGVTHSLAQYRGGPVIIFFYPEAMTPGCTTQACDFRDSLEPLRAAGYSLLGISRDAVEKQKRFAERDGLDYPLLSDPELTAHLAYGAYGEKNSYGRIVTSTIRSTFVVDEAGKIAQALYNVKATGHVARVRKLLGI